MYQWTSSCSTSHRGSTGSPQPRTAGSPPATPPGEVVLGKPVTRPQQYKKLIAAGLAVLLILETVGLRGPGEDLTGDLLVIEVGVM